METSTPGWYLDPTGRHEYRYWTGNQWSARVADSEAEVVNPAEALAQATSQDQQPDLIPRMQADPGWQLVYEDDDGLIFRRASTSA